MQVEGTPRACAAPRLHPHPQQHDGVQVWVLRHRGDFCLSSIPNMLLSEREEVKLPMELK